MKTILKIKIKSFKNILSCPSKGPKITCAQKCVSSFFYYVMCALAVPYYVMLPNVEGVKDVLSAFTIERYDCIWIFPFNERNQNEKSFSYNYITEIYIIICIFQTLKELWEIKVLIKNDWLVYSKCLKLSNTGISIAWATLCRSVCWVVPLHHDIVLQERYIPWFCCD